MLLALLCTMPTWADTPEAVMQQVMTRARAGQVAQLLPLLTPRSQQALARTWSHTSGMPLEEAWQSLRTNDLNLSTLWTQVVDVLPQGPLKFTRKSVRGRTVVSVNGRNFPLYDGQVALLETVLPSWLNVSPAAPERSSEDDGVVVVGERRDLADITWMTDQGVPPSVWNNW